MKNAIVVFVVIILLFSSTLLISATIRHTYHFSAPAIHQQPNGTSLVYFSNCYQAGKIGEPTLPVHPVALLLPPGQSADKIKIVFKDKKKLAQPLILSPKPAPRTATAAPDKLLIDQSVYRSTEAYLGFAPEVQTHFLFGHAVALACFSPIEYLPAKSTVFYYAQAEIEITTHADRRAILAQQNYRSSTDTMQKLSRIVDNFESVIGSYPPQNNRAVYDYLIITIAEFVDDYQPLVQFYNKRGVRSQIMAVEEIYQSMAGSDEAEKTRNYIINQVQTNGITYVLLAGDADQGQFGEMQVPMRGLYAKVLSGSEVYEDKNIPSDLYYAALDGNWNDDGDECWGEPGEDDLLPELAVARICADDSSEINALLHKIFSYQSNPVFEDATKMLMVGEKLWDDPLSYGADYLSLLIGDRNDNGYATVGMPPDLNFTYLYDKTLGIWNGPDLLKRINQGCNIIHHDGHSSSSMNMRLYRSDITNENFITVDGTCHLNPIIYSHGCLSAAVDMTNLSGQDCIAEMMLEIDHFASAYIGNSRYGWFNEGQTEGPSLHLHREFISALYSDSVVAIGAAHTLSRIRSAPFVTAPDQWEPGALRWCFYCCNVLGDPAMSLWTNQIKEFSNVKYPKQISELPTGLTIQTAVPKAKVAISDQGNLLATTIADNAGNAFLDIDATTASVMELNVTALNYKPFVGEITLETTKLETDRSNDELSFELTSLYPNPFNLATTIRFSLTQTSPVKLEIYNLMGQKIRTLFEGNLKAGWHQMNWSGDHDSGNITAAGIYFVKLTSVEGIRLRSVVLLK